MNQSTFGQVENLPAAMPGALNSAPCMSSPLPGCAGPGCCVCSDGSRQKRGLGRKSGRWQLKLDQSRRPHLHTTSTDRSWVFFHFFLFWVAMFKECPLTEDFEVFDSKNPQLFAVSPISLCPWARRDRSRPKLKYL